MTAFSIQPTGHEVTLQPSQLIVSKTDTTGHITYANRVFMEIAGYSSSELIGQPHNIIRHPDMPRGAFRLMWKTLQQGREFFAIVKNFTSKGDHYWVLANITPDYDNQNVLKGYFSVRRAPSRKVINTIIPVYAHMCQLERSMDKAHAPDASIAWLLEHLRQQGHTYESFILSLINPEQQARTAA